MPAQKRTKPSQTPTAARAEPKPIEDVSDTKENAIGAPEPDMAASAPSAENLTVTSLKPADYRTLEGRLAAVENLLVQMVAGLIVQRQLALPNPQALNGTAALREPQGAAA